MHGPINVKSPNNISNWQMGFNSAFKGLTPCCIPAVSQWITYRRCCSLVRAELELRLRSGREGLLALTITRHTKYIDFIVSE
jgi:hypothetical protein